MAADDSPFFFSPFFSSPLGMQENVDTLNRFPPSSKRVSDRVVTPPRSHRLEEEPTRKRNDWMPRLRVVSLHAAYISNSNTRWLDRIEREKRDHFSIC